jgi:hypothetical protein
MIRIIGYQNYALLSKTIAFIHLNDYLSNDTISIEFSFKVIFDYLTSGF